MMIVNWSIIIHRVGLMAGIAIATTVGILSEWMQRNHSKLVMVFVMQSTILQHAVLMDTTALRNGLMKLAM